MDSEEIERMISAVIKKESEEGITLTPKDIDMLRKLWSGEIPINDYIEY